MDALELIMADAGDSSSGILKNAPGTRPQRRESHSKGVRWDEEVIKEHDKERGTRQRIDEPKTPFNRSFDMGALTSLFNELT